MPPASLNLRAFGPLRVVRDGVETEVTRRRERNVLATLLAMGGRPVSADRLVVEVWGEEAPPQALASLQVAVSRLRSILEPDRSPRTPATVLASTSAGYALSLPTDAVDVWRFDKLVDRAIGADTAADRRDAARAARELWAAEPFAGCETESVTHELERLRERYLTTTEIAARAQLDLGDPEAAATLLAPLLPDHPYRERLWAAYALALYRAARQTDALESLRLLRERLADDLGIDPSHEITELELAVLNQDVALEGPAGRDPVAPAGAPSAPGPVSARVIAGRGAGTATLRQLLEQVANERRAAFVVVSGEPGIGKSHLVEQLPALAVGGSVLIGRCHADFAPALWPWLPVLRELWSVAADPTDTAVMESVLVDAPGEVQTGQGGVLRLFDAVSRLVTRAPVTGPLVVVLEDLHWADVTSLRLLAHLAASDLAAPVLFVLTLRAGDVATSDALVATMADLARAGSSRIRLDGLAPQEVAQLLGDVLGPHDSRLDEVVADVTAGNPFFVLEYARLVQSQPHLEALDLDRLPVPDGVKDVLRQRLVRLPEAARALLSTAAVAGRMEAELLSSLTGTPVDEVLDLLDLTLASGLLAEVGAGYEFAHALTREALAGELSAARRLRLHDQVSRALEARYADAPDVQAEVAHHADLAAPLGAEAQERAATALARAARVAQSRQAHDEALALWQRAVERAAGPNAHVLAIEALTGVAYSLIRLARAPEARSAVVEATRRARAVQRWDLVADAVAILNRGGVWAWREAGTRDEAFVGTLFEALAHVDEARQARLLAGLQVEHFFAWERDAGNDFGERSLEVARRTGDEALLVEILMAYIVAHSGPGTTDTRLARLEELRAHALQGEIAAFAEFTYARTLYESARVEEADAAAARCAASVAGFRHTGVELPLAWWFLSRARESEDPVQLASALDRLDEKQRTGTITAAGIDVMYRLRTSPEEGPLDPTIVDAARESGPGTRAEVAFEALERGETATALALLGEPTPSGASDYSVLAERCLRVAVLAGAGLTEGLDEAVARIEEYSGLVATFGAVDHLGAVDYFLALGLASLGERERAARHCASALELLERLGNRPWQRRAAALAEELPVTVASE